MQERVLHYKAASHCPNTAVTTIDRSMYNVSEQLNHLPATLPQIQYFVVIFQHYFLELRGILDYLEIYEPCINGILPPATTTANTIRAFTNNAHIV